MAETASITVKVADIEPVASFIAKTLRAEAWLRQLTSEQMAALPQPAIAAMQMLQEAVSDLNGGHLPTMAAVLAGPQEGVPEPK